MKHLAIHIICLYPRYNLVVNSNTKYNQRWTITEILRARCFNRSRIFLLINQIELLDFTMNKIHAKDKTSRVNICSKSQRTYFRKIIKKKILARKKKKNGTTFSQSHIETLFSFIFFLLLLIKTVLMIRWQYLCKKGS